MMASELVAVLQALIAEHGDRRVFAALDWDDIAEVNVWDAAEAAPFAVSNHPGKEFWLEP